MRSLNNRNWHTPVNAKAGVYLSDYTHTSKPEVSQLLINFMTIWYACVINAVRPLLTVPLDKVREQISFKVVKKFAVWLRGVSLLSFISLLQ